MCGYSIVYLSHDTLVRYTLSLARSCRGQLEDKSSERLHSFVCCYVKDDNDNDAVNNVAALTGNSQSVGTSLI